MSNVERGANTPLDEIEHALALGGTRMHGSTHPAPLTPPTPQPAPSVLPDTLLDVVDCPTCDGAGELLEAHPAFSAAQEQWYPNYQPAPCPDCDDGWIEVETCAACWQPVEKCGCDA